MIGEMVELVFGLLTGILSLLPASFVKEWIEKAGAIEYLSYINYFIPFNIMAQIGKSWLFCCGAYLVYFYVKSAYEETTKSKGGK